MDYLRIINKVLANIDSCNISINIFLRILTENNLLTEYCILLPDTILRTDAVIKSITPLPEENVNSKIFYPAYTNNNVLYNLHLDNYIFYTRLIHKICIRTISDLPLCQCHLYHYTIEVYTSSRIELANILASLSYFKDMNIIVLLNTSYNFNELFKIVLKYKDIIDVIKIVPTSQNYDCNKLFESLVNDLANSKEMLDEFLVLLENILIDPSCNFELINNIIKNIESIQPTLFSDSFCK